MKKINRLAALSFLLIASYLLSACGGTLPQSTEGGAPLKVEADHVAFTGTVEAISAGQMIVSGQVVAVDSQTTLDPNIAVGDVVKVEARVLQDGSVVALKVDASSGGDDSVNSNSSNDNGSNANVSPNDNSSAGNVNGSDNVNGAEDGTEVFGVVEAVTADSITVNGVVYTIADFSDFKDVIAVGDQVKLHVIANADGTFTIREIEKSEDAGDDNANSNDNSSDDNGNANDDNGNSNDDNSNDSNSNDDNGGNSNDDNGGGNSNDDDGGGGNSNNDDGGGGNGNGDDDGGGNDNG